MGILFGEEVLFNPLHLPTCQVHTCNVDVAMPGAVYSYFFNVSSRGTVSSMGEGEVGWISVKWGTLKEMSIDVLSYCQFFINYRTKIPVLSI